MTSSTASPTPLILHSPLPVSSLSESLLRSTARSVPRYSRSSTVTSFTLLRMFLIASLSENLVSELSIKSVDWPLARDDERLIGGASGCQIAREGEKRAAVRIIRHELR